jgi:hypothetical protein
MVERTRIVRRELGRKFDFHIILGRKSAVSGKITRKMATIRAIQKGVTPA